MVECIPDPALLQAREALIADIGSIVHKGEILTGFDFTGQVLALAHRTHPLQFEAIVRDYRNRNAAKMSSNLSAYIGYWCAKRGRTWTTTFHDTHIRTYRDSNPLGFEP